MKSERQNKTYRVEPINSKRLQEIAWGTKRSQSAVLNLAIEEYWKAYERSLSANNEPYANACN